MKLKKILSTVLQKIGKYFQVDLLYLIKGGTILSSGQIITLFIGFFISLAYANLIPKEVFGTYQFSLAIAGLLSILTLPNMEEAVAQAVARGLNGSIKPTIILRLKWSLLGSLITLLIASYYLLNNNVSLAIVMVIIAFFLPFTHALDTYNAYLKGKKLFKKTAKYDIIRAFSNLVTLIPVMLLTDNVYIILITFFSSTVILNIIFLYNTLTKYNLNDKIDPKTIPFGIHLNIVGIIGVIANYIDKIIIWAFLGPIEVAIYTFAISLPDKILLMFKPISSLAMPKFSNMKDDVLKKYIPIKVLQSFIFTIPIAALYIISAPYIFKIFFPQYLESVIYSQIFAIIIIFEGTRLMTTYLNAKMKQKQIYYINTIILITKIILMLILVPIFKIYGMVSALVINQFLTCTLLFVMMKKKIK